MFAEKFQEKIDVLFYSVDRDGNGTMDTNEFFKFCKGLAFLFGQIRPLKDEKKSTGIWFYRYLWLKDDIVEGMKKELDEVVKELHEK